MVAMVVVETVEAEWEEVEWVEVEWEEAERVAEEWEVEWEVGAKASAVEMESAAVVQVEVGQEARVGSGEEERGEVVMEEVA